MVVVETYVFIDLETTGLPSEELNKTRITELSMVAVKRPHLLATRPGSTPRVQHKLTMCFNPCKPIADDGTKVTGLCNFLLENEPVFNQEVFNMINTFLNVLSKPVCLIAQNGLGFDFPILKNRLEKLKVSFADDLLCADCYHGFYDILEKDKQDLVSQIEETKLGNVPALSNGDSQKPLGNGNNSPKSLANVEKSPKSINAAESQLTSKIDEVDFYTPNIKMQAANETTPKQNRIVRNTKRNPKVCRRMPWGSGPKPKEPYKLKDIYERVLNRPAVDAHRAENDCIFALEISTALSKQFVEWVDENCVMFSEIKPMTIGVPLGF